MPPEASSQASSSSSPPPPLPAAYHTPSSSEVGVRRRGVRVTGTRQAGLPAGDLALHPGFQVRRLDDQLAAVREEGLDGQRVHGIGDGVLAAKFARAGAVAALLLPSGAHHHPLILGLHRQLLGPEVLDVDLQLELAGLRGHHRGADPPATDHPARHRGAESGCRRLAGGQRLKRGAHLGEAGQEAGVVQEGGLRGGNGGGGHFLGRLLLLLRLLLVVLVVLRRRRRRRRP